MKEVLAETDGTFHIIREQGRIYVEAEGSFDYDETIEQFEESLRHRWNLSGGSDQKITGLRHFLKLCWIICRKCMVIKP